MFSKSQEEKQFFNFAVYLSMGSYTGILKDKCSSVFTFSVMAARIFDKEQDQQICVYIVFCKYIGSTKKSIFKNFRESRWTYLQVLLRWLLEVHLGISCLRSSSICSIQAPHCAQHIMQRFVNAEILQWNQVDFLVIPACLFPNSCIISSFLLSPTLGKALLLQ